MVQRSPLQEAAERLLPLRQGPFDKPGLLHLKKRVIALSNEPLAKPMEADRIKIGWASSTGPIYQDEMDARSRESMVRLALMEVADALGDVDGFIAQYDDETREVPRIAAEIAERLLGADRAEEALVILDAAQQRSSSWPEFDWENARIAVLEALGRDDEAQAMHWSCFERSLSLSHLRDYLKRLPDFDDIDAETRAFEFARTYRSLLGALRGSSRTGGRPRRRCRTRAANRDEGGAVSRGPGSGPSCDHRR